MPVASPPDPRRITMYVYDDVRTDARVLREAATLAARGWSVTIVGRTADPFASALEREWCDGVEIVRVPPPGRWRRPWRILGAPLRFLARGLSRLRGQRTGGETLAWLVIWRFEILGWAARAAAVGAGATIHHGHDLSGLAAAVTAARADGSPLVYDAHELFLDAHATATRPAWARAWLRRAERRWAHRASALVTVNADVAAVLDRTLRPPRIEVIHNCPPRWTPPTAGSGRLRQAAAVPAGSPIILYHGSLAPHRGLPQLCDALGAMTSSAVHLAVLGVGRPDPTFVDRLAADPGLAGRVHVLPAVPPAELLEWVSGADVDVMAIQPTTRNHRLSTPNKLFESLAAGVPVVASDFGPMRRIILDDPAGPLGAVCDPTDPAAIADAITGILALPPAERAELRARCLRAAHERWNWETEGARLVALYDELGGAD